MQHTNEHALPPGFVDISALILSSLGMFWLYRVSASCNVLNCCFCTVESRAGTALLTDTWDCKGQGRYFFLAFLEL
jgi:hypothetical protein